MISVNGIVVLPTIFPDGTSQVWNHPNWKLPLLEGDKFLIEWFFHSENEFLWLAQLQTLIRRFAVETHLGIPYLPYARQDKQPSLDSAFALYSFAELLNHLRFDKISCFDPHSDVADRLINNFVRIRPDELISSIAKGYDYICYPDDGAAKRYKVEGNIIVGHKIREQSTGRIVQYELEGHVPEASAVLVVDDICDGGATFILLGKELKKYNVQLGLYVSHGIFSKGLEELKKYYSEIFTTSSRLMQHKELIVYNPFTFERVQ